VLNKTTFLEGGFFTLVELYPAEKSYNLLLIEQYVKFGEIIKAASLIVPFLVIEPKTKADWQALLLYYKILRVKTYAKSEVSYARRRGLNEMKNVIAILKKGDFRDDDAMEIAEDAAKMEDVKTAVTIYQKVLDNSKQKCTQNCMQLYANAGRFMLSQRLYVASSKFYFLAQDHATVLDEQREYFIAALKSLQSGDMLNLAMNEAGKHTGNLADDRETLLFLSRLALAANKNKLAEKYIERVLQLKLYKSSK
jgi:hypothetical protein